MKNIKFILLFFLATILAGLYTAKAQEKSPDEVKKIVESKNFVFTAETAYPARGGNQQLSSGYDLTVTKSSIVSYLPFYGRAQTIPIAASEGGIKFTSTNFEYEAVPSSKGWNITIKTKDVSHVQQLYLTIYTNGSATLDVMNINRDNISFRGYIK